jgi:orotate phosphoribosyltransferase
MFYDIVRGGMGMLSNNYNMATLPQRINQIARIAGTFTLRSGKTSDVYFDKYQFEADPQLLYDIAQAMKSLIPPGTQVLAGLEMGGIPMSLC